MNIVDKLLLFFLTLFIMVAVGFGMYVLITGEEVYVKESINADINVQNVVFDKKDTDNDGFSDQFERNKSFLDTHHKDVVVEVDYDKSVNKSDFGIVVERFDKAPVENPDGENGIDLHIIQDDTNLNLPKNMTADYYRNNYQIDSDYKMKGYYHAYIVDNALDRSRDIGNQNLNGYTNTDRFSMVVEENKHYPKLTQETFMHELGHQLGLFSSTFDGIDSRKYRSREYRSLMNYNYIAEYDDVRNHDLNRSSLRYDDGTDQLDEWEIIGQNLSENRPCGSNIDDIIC